jgi:hypothetical protein
MSDDIHSDGTVLTEMKWRPGGARGNTAQLFDVGGEYLFAVATTGCRGEGWDVQCVEIKDAGDDDHCVFVTEGGRYEWDWADVEWYVPVDEMDLPR